MEPQHPRITTTGAEETETIGPKLIKKTEADQFKNREIEKQRHLCRTLKIRLTQEKSWDFINQIAGAFYNLTPVKKWVTLWHTLFSHYTKKMTKNRE